MKSMSIGLIKGIIDQIDQVVRITWTKPRQLTMDKIKVMREKLNGWQELCEGTHKMLENHVEDIINY